MTVAAGLLRHVPARRYGRWLSPPQGTWLGQFGSVGYVQFAGLGTPSPQPGTGANDASSLPAGVTYTITNPGGGRFRWTNDTPDVRALQHPDNSTRRACTLFSANTVGSTITVDIDFTDAWAGRMSVYCLDWDGAGHATGRRQALEVTDATRTVTVGPLGNHKLVPGLWLSGGFAVGAGGTITLTAELVQGANAVISGVFLD